jgi:glycosyltransferase involved in cell wall biosynthesis
MIAAIQQRKQPRDIICTIGGASQADVTNAHPDLMAVEYCIGYEGCYANYRVFQSHAWRHFIYGMQGLKLGGRFFDEVIPGFFETEKFPSVTPEDYVLYVGRIIPYKGVKIACEAARLAGVKLKLIGHGDPATIPQIITYGEYLGAVNEATRNEVMSKARALICPTVYVEPFGMISAEAQLNGTPVIATDYGGFTESVEHGFSGFRCNLLGEFVSAIAKIDTLNREDIRKRAQALYSMETGSALYANYFRRLNTLWDQGWNTEDFEVL